MSTAQREVRVLITGESENPTKINLKSGKFKLIIDEPKMMGGTDEGPSPVQVLLMSLAGCQVTDNIKADTMVNVSIA